MKVFITGDRSFSPAYMPLVAVELLRAVGAGDEIATGELGGVEDIVRTLAAMSNIDIKQVPGDKTMLAERAVALEADGWSVVVIHTAPELSSVWRTLVDAFGDDDERIRLATHGDLMV